MINDMVQNIIDGINSTLSNMFVSATSMCLEMMNSMFNTSITALRSEVAITPQQFSPDLVETLRNITTRAILPIAMILLTYVFCYQIFEMVTSQNKGSEFDVGDILMLVIKTTMMIMLATNAFNISLAFK